MKLLIFLLSASFMQGASLSLATRVNAVIQHSGPGQTAFWGVVVRDLDSSRTLVRLNGERFFVPASNTKLFTTALALSSLGANHQVETLVTAAALPDAAGRLNGPLTLVGAGDPNLSGRLIPYAPDQVKLDPLTALRDLAEQLYAGGVRFVKGNVVGDDSAFLYEPYPPGWGIEDPLSSDGAPVSALCVNDNTVRISFAADSAVLQPSLPIFTIENRLLPGATREVHFARDPGSATLRLWGTLPPGQMESEVIAVDDPARFAALALMKALEERGIVVEGTAEVRHRYPGEVTTLPAPALTLARHTSPPLLEVLRITDKVSQNLHAEMLLRLVGQGSRPAGLEALSRFTAQAGIAASAYSFQDGSGLSRLNVVTPDGLVQLLTYMAASPLAADFVSLLPISGVDGSLRLRFANSRAKGKIYAKTGSLSHTSALSGYAVRRDGHRLAFAVMVNNYNGSSATVREAIDRICALLVE